MDILGTLADAGATAMTGGVFGLIGNVATKVVGLFEAQAQARQQEAQFSQQLELLRQQTLAKQGDAQNQQAITNLTGAWSGLTASLNAEATVAATYPWVNAVRALVRPALTFGLSGFLCAAFFALPAGDASRADIASSLVFAAVTSIVWWFGDRAPKRGQK